MDPARFDPGRGMIHPSRFDARGGVQVWTRFVNGGGGLYDRQAAGALTGRLHGLAEHLDQFQIQCRGEKRDVRR